MSLVSTYRRTYGALVRDNEHTEDELLRTFLRVARRRRAAMLVDAFAQDPKRYYRDVVHTFREVSDDYRRESLPIVEKSYTRAEQRHREWLDAVGTLLGAGLAAYVIQHARLLRRYRDAASKDPQLPVLVEVRRLANPPLIREYTLRVMARIGATSRTAYRTILMNALRTQDRRACRRIPAVVGYRRIAAQSVRTCAACIALDGKFYKLDEEMEEHPNGRCQLIPVTRDYDPKWTSARDWLMSQPEDVQRQVLGPGRLAALRSARLSWDDIAVVHHHEEYGPTLGIIRVRDI